MAGVDLSRHFGPSCVSTPKDAVPYLGSRVAIPWQGKCELLIGLNFTVGQYLVACSVAFRSCLRM